MEPPAASSPRRYRSRTQPRVLVIDDEPDLLELLEITMIRLGLDVTCADSVAGAIAKLDSQEFDLCLTDMRLPDGEGLDIIAHIHDKALDVPVAVITAFGSTENAVAALKAGAFDYLAKPVDLKQLRALVKQAVKPPEKARLPEGYILLGESPAIAQVRDLLDRVAQSLAPVFINGESGSGKEVAARLIHHKGPRAAAPFIPVNCGAIPENLMESEFFGYRKGSFTGADSDREGFFQAAHGGTLFLDEVADLPLAMQVKLLRVIQEKKVRRIGSQNEEPVDVRIICASHKKLAPLVAAGQFRQDLFFRLHVLEVNMPALREMREDVPLIAQAILEKLARGRPAGLAADALAALQHYSFPGNVRELENILERGLSLAPQPSQIHEEDLYLTPLVEKPVHLDAAASSVALAAGEIPGSLETYLDDVERAALLAALERTRFNRTEAAKLLGITFRAMRYRMERLGIK